MKRGIVSLILVLVASTAVWANDDAQVMAIQQGDDDNFVFMGPQHGSYMGVRTEDVTKERLDALKIPFAFVTGYSSEVRLPEAFMGRPRLLKPCSTEALETALRLHAGGTRDIEDGGRRTS